MSRAALIATVISLPLATQLRGNETDEKQAWLGLMEEQAKRYEFVALDDRSKIQITAKPVFRHDAPSRNSDDIGGVWIWKDQHNRPVAAGTVFGWTSRPNTRTVMHEFCSLAREPFEASWRGATQTDRWSPRETADWKPLPSAPVPTERKAVFRVQLRKQSRRFNAHTFDRGRRRWQLRLIPSPVYQYECPKLENTLGGAVFVICQDTNTDVVLAIEAVRADKEKPYRFEYALGSFTDWDLHVELDEQEIWGESPRDPRGSRDRHWVRGTGTIQLSGASKQ